MRIDLKVSFRDNDLVKGLGARWDASRKTWYVVDPPDMMKFRAWIPSIKGIVTRQSAQLGVFVEEARLAGYPVGDQPLGGGAIKVAIACGCSPSSVDEAMGFLLKKFGDRLATQPTGRVSSQKAAKALRLKNKLAKFRFPVVFRG